MKETNNLTYKGSKMEILEGGRGYEGYRSAYSEGCIKLDDEVILEKIKVGGYNGDPNQFHVELLAFCSNGAIYNVHPPEGGLAGIRWKLSDYERDELREKSFNFEKLENKILNKLIGI